MTANHGTEFEAVLVLTGLIILWYIIHTCNFTAKPEPKAKLVKPAEADKANAAKGKESDAGKQKVKIVEPNKDDNTEDDDDSSDDLMSEDDDEDDSEVHRHLKYNAF